MKTFKPIALICALLILALGCFAQAPDFNNFQPKFQDDVFILNPHNPDPNNLVQAKTQVNPAYALSESSALELMVVLKDYKPVLFHSGPFGWLSSWGFAPTRAVPWLLFPDGTVCNAGLLAWYWSHGFPPALVWGFVKLDIDAMLKFTADHPGVWESIARMP